jgi:hypothetical protein
MDKTRQSLPPQLGNPHHIGLLKTFLIISGGGGGEGRVYEIGAEMLSVTLATCA